MKTFYLLRLENNANKVIFETEAWSAKDAIEAFNRHLDPVKLDENGYAKVSFSASMCIAERWESCCQVP